MVREAEFTKEAVLPQTELPGSLRDGARQRSIGRREAAGEDAHLLLLAAYDLPRIQGQAVGGARRPYPVHDDFVVAGRRAHETHRGATPHAHRLPARL